MTNDYFLLSRTGYYADWVVVPFLCIALLGLIIGPTALLFPLGFLAWSLIEYSVHRWVFHGGTWLAAEHQQHHDLPASYIAAPWWSGSAVITIAALVGWGVFGVGAIVFLFGVVAGYLVYLAAHDLMHHAMLKEDHPLRPASMRHIAHHHKGSTTNYSIVFPLWDILLRTRG